MVGWQSHHTSLTQAKKDLKKEKKMSPKDAWQGYLKTWDQWNSQNFQWHCPWTPQKRLTAPHMNPGCKDQRPDAYTSWKTEVSKSAWIKPCTGNAVEWASIIAEIPPPPQRKKKQLPSCKVRITKLMLAWEPTPKLNSCTIPCKWCYLTEKSVKWRFD